MADKKTILAALEAKQAELDVLDDQLLDMDSALPLDAPPTEEFDLLSQKREQLEDDIRKMREGVSLISEWEKFKGGQWSEEVKQQLNSMDDQIASAAGPETGLDAPVDLGAPVPEMAPPAPEVAPAPAAPAPALEAPAAPEAPAPAEVAGEPAPAPVDALPAPTASAISKKNNYAVRNKKGEKAQENAHMATETKPTLKAGLAEKKAQREAIKKEAQSRVASAWTIAKTMLPTAPADVQKAFAASLLANPTKVLTAALRQTAVNAHYTKIAEEFKKVHKVELNDLLENPSVLAKEKAAVESELKGEAKNATTKKADDRKDAGPQPEKYDDGRHGSEPAEIDAGKAADRPADSVNKTEGGSNNIKEASKKKAHAEGEKCAGCEHCKGAAAKTADEPLAPEAPAIPEAPAAEEAAPAPDAAVEAPAEIPAGEEGAAAEAETVLTEEKKLEIHEKIEEAEQAIQSLEEEILEEGNEELNIENIFNDEEMEDKVSSLANEGDEHTAGDEDMDFFAPSAAAEMEANMDGDKFGSMDEIFSMTGADADPLAALIAGDLKTAAQVEGMEVLPAFSGELANYFNEAGNDNRDNETDHEGDLLAEAAEAVKPEDQGAKRQPQDQQPKLESPKEAAKKPAVIRHIKSAAAGQNKKPVNPVAAALFGDDDSF